MKKFRLEKNSGGPFLVKTSGGAASQLLGLMNAIQVSQSIERPFIIRHYPFSTGSYYPIAIKFLLHPEEIDFQEGRTKGLKTEGVSEVGKVIKEHPLLAKHFSYEKLLNLIRKLKLEKMLLRLRNEWPIYVSLKRLYKVPRRISTISGGYFPISNKLVHQEMDLRFKRANRLSPYSDRNDNEICPDVVIHYRIGDKRGSYAFPELGIDGILDPESFKEILKLENRENSTIYVVSDEPHIAVGLLETVGIKSKINPIGKDLWSDLYLMTRAELLICPWSMVSQIAATIVTSYGRKAYYPAFTSTGNTIDGEMKGIITYIPKFLQQEHPIYSGEFDLEEGSHSIY